jgi:hypothetical protein
MDNTNIILKYGKPVDFGNYRSKYSFNRGKDDDLEKAINEDNYGVFRVKASLAGITWHRICDPHSIYYLYTKRAGKILRELLKIGKEDRTVFPVWTLLYNTLTNPHTAFEEIIRGFAECSAIDRDAKLQMLKDCMEYTEFVNRAFGIGGAFDIGGYTQEKLYHLFEELFPGEGLFPHRFGTWTDDRDGTVYGTVRCRSLEWLRMPLKFGMDSDGLISIGDFQVRSESILPSGWHVPSDSELDSLRILQNVPRDPNVLFGAEEYGKAPFLSKDGCWPILPGDYACRNRGEDGYKRGSLIWNEQVGQNGFDFKPTYGTGDSRESTVMTTIVNYNGRYERRCFRLFTDYNLFREPECSRQNDPDRYDACVYERTCIMLCREIPGVKA